jgi:hypothetical protein
MGIRRNEEIKGISWLLKSKTLPSGVCTDIVQHLFSTVFKQTEAREEIVVIY